jgi:RNA polymerase sigma-70 factor, ECF subfamily
MLTFHDIYERHAQDVYRYSCWLCGNADEADDITSEAFARAWAGREKIRTETVKAYLFTIARNVYLHNYRRQKLQMPLDDSHSDSAPSTEYLVTKRMELADTMKAMQKLTEEDRTALLLRVQHELSYEEIARVMQLKTTTVKVKVHRARLKLAAMLAGEES